MFRYKVHELTFLETICGFTDLLRLFYTSTKAVKVGQTDKHTDRQIQCGGATVSQTVTIKNMYMHIHVTVRLSFTTSLHLS